MSAFDNEKSAAALRAAANVGDVAAFQHYLRSYRSVPFSRDCKGRSALHLAVSGGHPAVLQFLFTVADPKEVDIPDGSGYTPLQIAAAEGHEEIIKLLLAHGANVNTSDNVHGNSALHEASWRGYSRSMRLLIAKGANLNKFNYGGFTALHLCCQNGHNQSCRELLLAGCLPDLQNNYGDTSLHTAARYGHAGVMRILISAQCKVSAENKNGDTALHIAAAMGRRKLTRILLEAGCNKHAHNKQNETPKDIALRKNLSEVSYIIDSLNGKQDKTKKYKKYSYEGKSTKGNTYTEEKRHWSPYGCHYYPDSEVFPCPRLNSLPKEPLKHGEQYYLDLAGNICKGPVGVGYTCYCAPFFKHLRIQMERDKREFQRVQVKLHQRVTNLEYLLQRNRIKTSDVSKKTKKRKCSFSRSRSLEILDTLDKPLLQTARSMDDVEHSNDIKQLGDKMQPNIIGDKNNNSESSDEETCSQNDEFIRNDALLSYSSNYDIFSTTALPRHRGGVYSPTVSNMDSKYMENVLKMKKTKIGPSEFFNNQNTNTYEYRFQPEIKYIEFPCLQNYGAEISNSKYYEQGLTSKIAKLKILGVSKNSDIKIDARDTTSYLQDSGDRDTNNDSGYSTKVYGSSKGNSPNFCGQIDTECLGASSLV